MSDQINIECLETFSSKRPKIGSFLSVTRHVTRYASIVGRNFTDMAIENVIGIHSEIDESGICLCCTATYVDADSFGSSPREIISAGGRISHSVARHWTHFRNDRPKLSMSDHRAGSSVIIACATIPCARARSLTCEARSKKETGERRERERDGNEGDVVVEGEVQRTSSAAKSNVE